MPYPRIMGEEILQKILPYTQKMTDMPEGSSFTIEAGPEAIKQIRYWLYCWLHTQGYDKSTFRISSDGPNAIRVHKRAFQGKIKESPIEALERPSDRAVDFALNNLTNVEDENKAIEITNNARAHNRLSASEVLQALAAWRVIKNRES